MNSGHFINLIENAGSKINPILLPSLISPKQSFLLTHPMKSENTRKNRVVPLYHFILQPT